MTRTLPSFCTIFLTATCLLSGCVQVQSSSTTAAEQTLSDQSLLWGPYKPNLYLGIRPKIANSLTAGLLWGGVDTFNRFQNNVRHTCEQHAGMMGYGWDSYDARTGGTQTFHDDDNEIDIETSFVKVPGGEHGGNWGLRVKGTPRSKSNRNVKTSMFFYTSLEGPGALGVLNKNDVSGLEGVINIKGETTELGGFKMEIVEKSGNKHPKHRHESYKEKRLDRSFVASMSFPDTALWQIKPILFAELRKSVERSVEKYGQEAQIPPEQLYTIGNRAGNGNLHFVQKVFEGPFEFDILYSSSSASEQMSQNTVSKEIKSNKVAFSERHRDVFSRNYPFNKPKYDDFSKSLFSNLLGGIGYFHGDAMVDLSYDQEYEEDSEDFWEVAAEARRRNIAETVGPFELLTSVPSRTFFPRGFLWDEGFHLLPILDWDSDLALQIIDSWFNLMDEDGWIAREQILGAEARSKVPPEFQVQYPHYANPPTLFLVLEIFLKKMQTFRNQSDKAYNEDGTSPQYHSLVSDVEAGMNYLRKLYPFMQKHYEWFRKTQRGGIFEYGRKAFSNREAYRWRGRTMNHTLTSGLDDYPRAQPPHPGELHVDLLSWMRLVAKTMNSIAVILQEDEDAEDYADQVNAMAQNVDDLHWSEKEQAYCDATIDEFDENRMICHKGYVSLFPFLTGMVGGDHPHLGAILDLIEDPEHLWSDYGLRSLSASDELYHSGEDYWRGPIWVNINYLALVRLLELSQAQPSIHAARMRSIYNRLRRNIVDTVYRSWKETGFAWEQYNPETGAGQRTQHFTGWTSLVVKIMNMPDLAEGKEVAEHGRADGPDEL